MSNKNHSNPLGRGHKIKVRFKLCTVHSLKRTLCCSVNPPSWVEIHFKCTLHALRSLSRNSVHTNAKVLQLQMIYTSIISFWHFLTWVCTSAPWCFEVSVATKYHQSSETIPLHTQVRLKCTLKALQVRFKCLVWTRLHFHLSRVRILLSVTMVANMISHITRELPARFCCYRIFLLFIRIFFIRMTLWNRKYKYYCLCFSFVTLYPSFITFFWQAYLFRWLQIAFLTLGNTNNAQFLRSWVLAVDVFFW